MKYLLTTYGVLMVLFSGVLTAKADAFISGNFAGQLTSPCCSPLEPEGIFTPVGVVRFSTPFGTVTGFDDGGMTTFSFDTPSTGQYSFGWGAVMSGIHCPGPPFGPPTCLAGQSDGSDAGILPKPTFITLPGEQPFSQYKWKSVGPFEDSWAFFDFERPPTVTTGGESGFVVLNYTLDVFQQPFTPFGDLQVTLSPAPEPGTLLLFASGLVPLLWIFRHQGPALKRGTTGGCPKYSEISLVSYGQRRTDRLFATTSPISTITFHGNGQPMFQETFGGGPAGPSPYSLTLVTVYTDSSVGGRVTGGDSGAIGSVVEPVVPEPSTLLLFGSGLLLLGMIVHRKQLHARNSLIDVA